MAKFRRNISLFLKPVHLLYLIMLILGLVKDFGAYCEVDVYPKVFNYQYSIFFFTYLVFIFLHYNDYFIQWDERAYERLTTNIDELDHKVFD